MRLLIVHRRYRHLGGEDVFISQSLLPALKRVGAEHTYLELPALFSVGFLSSFLELFFMSLGLEKLRPSYHQIKRTLGQSKFTHVLFNNLAPTISLDAPALCQATGLKTLWWLHNARISCANGLLYNGQTACHQCLSVGSRKNVLFNCQKNMLQSLLYGAVYRNRRVLKKLSPFINKYICVSRYTAENLTFALKKISLSGASKIVIYHPASPKVPAILTSLRLENLLGKSLEFYLFLGRLSLEKGADIFLDMAVKFPQSNFVMAGSGPLEEKLKAAAPSNVIFVGQVNEEEKNWLYSRASALIIPSRVPENSPLVIFESQSFNVPIVYPRGGGAEEIVGQLKRSGCALEDFTGQKFDKGMALSSSLQDEFDLNLLEILDMTSPMPIHENSNDK